MKLGPKYRGHAGAWYQQYEVTMADGRTRLAQVPVAYGRSQRQRPRSRLRPGSAMTDASRHDAWIRVSGWRDGKDYTTGRRYSSIGEPGDFHAGVREYLTAEGRLVRGYRVPVTRFDWHVTRQFTDREPQGPRGERWTYYLAEGEADTMAHAKSAALKELRRLRAEHIVAGGDVGYGDAMTGEEIRAILKIQVDTSQPAVLAWGHNITSAGRVVRPDGC